MGANFVELVAEAGYEAEVTLTREPACATRALATIARAFCARRATRQRALWTQSCSRAIIQKEISQMLRIQQVMTQNVYSCRPDDSLECAARAM